MMRRLVFSYILRSTSSFHPSTPPPLPERSTLLSHLSTFPSKSIPVSTHSFSSTTLLTSNLHEARTQGSNHAVGLLHEAITSNPNPYDDLETALSQTGVVLTTPIVSKILQRLQFEEKTAFRFFTWAGHQAHYYSHEASTYNEMIDILSSTKYKNKQFRIVIDMLDYMKRNNKESVPADVMLEILRKYCERYLTHVQKFAKRKRIRVKTQPEINAFNFLLDALCKCGLVKEAEALVRKMKFKVKPDANTYNVLFFGCCRVRDPKKAMELMEEMIEAGHKPENFTYCAAIDAFCQAGMVDEAAELFEFMVTKGSAVSAPTARTFALMIVALAKSGKEDECFELIGRMIAMGCLPDVSTYKDVVEGMCNAGKVEEAYRFLDEMSCKGYPPDIVTYNCFLRVLCESKKSDEAVKLYKRMVETRCVPSVQTYNMLITMFFDMADPDGAYNTWREMDERGCGQDVETYCAMVNGLFDCGREKEACFLLEEVVSKGMKLPYRAFDTFLMRLSEVGNIKVIHKVSEHMKKFYNHSMARRFALSEKRKSTKLRGK
ncbi:pentatricopeptide repeat-containing protein At1g73400, mitochondrial [Brassica rapa]|uniref:pentatricopeptide repeat-containing protein At1g73400, mitochondrial n=1 Tax=Brassica campestris TaxID=3711 RepID=UPI00142D7282|nr:pentatricopeptide repeat-containing protein At1g73400, mitochondrial [Brassica rapa]